jgi:hypothetical protein|tara:strand:+ start:93 stop:254 length:162 start_codon:yes stop_codon:yes gene_type:complete
MANSKQTVVKAKHRKRKNRKRDLRIEELRNAKKKTLRQMKNEGGLPKVLEELI